MPSLTAGSVALRNGTYVPKGSCGILLRPRPLDEPVNPVKSQQVICFNLVKPRRPHYRPPDSLQLELTGPLDLHGVLDLGQHSRVDEAWLAFVAQSRGDLERWRARPRKLSGRPNVDKPRQDNASDQQHPKLHMNIR